MAWTTVETPNAKYIIMLSAHTRKLPASPKSFDAAILESGDLSASELVRYRQFRNLVEQAIKEKKQIWVTDIESSRQTNVRFFIGSYVESILGLFGLKLFTKTIAGRRMMSRREFITRSMISIGLLSPILSTIPLLTATNKEIKNHKMWKGLTNVQNLIAGKSILSVRNAITAEKAESFLAPRLFNELGRKPTIAMAWGYGHYGIKTLLEHPEERHRILKEINLEKFVQRDYPVSFKLHLDEKGKIQKIEKFPETLKIKRVSTKGVEVLTRRKLLARMFGRRRLA